VFSNPFFLAEVHLRLIFVHLRLIFDVLLVAGLPAAPVVPARQGRA
jgi:hypothetical protein